MFDKGSLTGKSWVALISRKQLYRICGVLCSVIVVGHNWYQRTHDEHVDASMIRLTGDAKRVTSEHEAPVTVKAALLAIPVETTASVPLPPARTDVVRNLSAQTQAALVSNSAEEKAGAIHAINACKNFQRHHKSLLDDPGEIGVPLIQLTQVLARSNAECQTLSAHDLSLTKELAVGAYKLGGGDGAYLYATEFGIPQDPIERTQWLNSLRSAAYAGSALSQALVNKEIGVLFEDQYEAYGFRMTSLRLAPYLSHLPDHVLYAIVAIDLTYDKDAPSVQRSIGIMNDLLAAAARKKLHTRR